MTTAPDLPRYAEDLAEEIAAGWTSTPARSSSPRTSPTHYSSGSSRRMSCAVWRRSGRTPERRASPSKASHCCRRRGTRNSQGKTIPGLVTAACATLGAKPPDDASLRKAGLFVLHLHTDDPLRLSELERFDPIL